MLKQRILTALVLLPLMLAMLFCANAWLWAAFSAVIALLAVWEYGRICGFAPRQNHYYVGATAFFMLTAYAGGWQLPAFVWLLVGAFWLLAMPLWLLAKWKPQAGGGAAALGWLLMLPFWFGLLQLRPDSSHAVSLLALMLLVWIADTAAYFAGRRFGKRPLAPVISPKKSWEGAVGGVLAVLAYLTLARSNGWLFAELSWGATMLIGVLLTFVSIGGDLLESWLKRAAGIKDSSNLLPGHGGVFDRTDSLIAVISLFTAVQVLCQNG